MHALRNSRLLASLALAWLVLTLGVATASPLVQPRLLEMVCTSMGGMQMVALDSDSPLAQSPHALDCPLCLLAAIPPPSLALHLPQPQPLARALQPVVAARIAALVGAPLPARGPPALV
ncbi:DUF2946 family protein [Comamonas endophytica]|uniref:DUF2946 domain-containing protein n=1 Tax=Comamonas endophytica TaxID=2949090 RepID=A0ABY6GFZ6_9BURK|nr:MULTISPECIES: DUF2946 family protein [unclassified Acidovorax]MCD2513253.1 DUF2946 domain-containing protein [Acidovorax sp. D4N7]UYG53404.1 DUF2946 domain-containing protein [Acidovorax sp. 5MLIR]